MMNLVSDAELASIRCDVQRAALDKTCVIRRATIAGSGGLDNETETQTIIATVPAGMREPSPGLLQQYASQIGSMIAHVVQMPVGTDVEAKDELTIDGFKLIVQAEIEPHSYAALTSVLACEVRRG